MINALKMKQHITDFYPVNKKVWGVMEQLIYGNCPGIKDVDDAKGRLIKDYSMVGIAP